VTSEAKNIVEEQMDSNIAFTCDPSFDYAAGKHSGFAQDGGFNEVKWQYEYPPY
jgi:hypothetical protein